jgi:uncharacterized membrane protein
MASVRVGTHIDQPLEDVFRLFTDIEGAADRVTNILRIEVLTTGGFAIGMRWLETREVLGREATEELSVTALEHGRAYTITTETHGTKFDCTFRFERAAGGTDVLVEFDVVPQSFGGLLVAPFGWMMMNTVERSLEQDLAELKAAAERRHAMV